MKRVRVDRTNATYHWVSWNNALRISHLAVRELNLHCLTDHITAYNNRTASVICTAKDCRVASE